VQLSLDIGEKPKAMGLVHALCWRATGWHLISVGGASGKGALGWPYAGTWDAGLRPLAHADLHPQYPQKLGPA